MRDLDADLGVQFQTDGVAGRKLTPMPAMAACLMVSVLLISMAMLISAKCSPKPSSIECRVSEPFCSTTKGSRISLAMAVRFLEASRWLDAATIT